jgi:hypothetical protein
MVHTLRQILSWFLGLGHLLCLDLLGVGPGQFFGYSYWYFLLRSCMMHLYE